MKDERFFEMASAELRAGTIRPGLRAKAFSDAEGEENRAQALYLKYRVAQLVQEELEMRQAEDAAKKQRKKQERDAGETARKEQVEAEGLTLVHFILIGLLTLIFGLIIWKLL
ncbi:hypothetical protein [Pseudomonas hormoni]